MSNQHDVLGPEIRRFLSLYIDSVGTLDVLLFFQKRSECAWTIEQLAVELRNNASAIEVRVQDLLQKGILREGAAKRSYQYAPHSESVVTLVENLCQLYPKYQARIIDQIYSPRNGVMREFADAFRLKREGEDG